MEENGGDSLPDEKRCKRNDGRKWRCQRPVMDGRTLCEAHYLQGRIRQHKDPVPENLKLERQKASTRTLKIEENPNEKSEISVKGNVGCSNSLRKRGKRKPLDEENPIENLEKRIAGCSNLPPNHGKRTRKEAKSKSKSSVDISEDLDDTLKKMNLKKGDLQLDSTRGYLNRQIEKKKGKQPQKEDIVKELKYGRLEISQSSPSTTPITVNNGGLSNVKIRVPASSSVPTRFFRSKNIDPLPISTMQILPSIKANVKAATKKCHWCRMCSYRVLVKCLTCKNHFFCEDCIGERHQDKADVKKQCPVCCGTCNCRACIKGRSKEVKTKDLVVYNGEGKFDRSQQLLYMIHLLLPLLEEANQEKIIEMDIEAKIKGKDNEIPNFDSSYCAFCDGNDKNEGEDEILINKSLYFSIRQELGDKNLEHFTKHWVKGQPLIIGDVIKSELELNWDPIFLFCMYLERSAISQNDKEVKLKICSDWCEVDMGRNQIFMGGKTHANVWLDKLKFKVRLSSGIFQEHFPSHYAAVMHDLPLQQYINPLSGILNLAANMLPESQNHDLGPFVYISHGRPEDLTRGDFLTKLCYHAYDEVNILVHATDLTISKKNLNKVNILLSKYSKQDHNEPSSKNKIDQPCGKSSFSSEVTQQSELEDKTNGDLSDDSSIGDYDDEDLCEDEFGSSSSNGGKLIDTCGAQWDVFRRQDVPKLVEFLSKYSNELNKSHHSPTKVVHPILDETFYLDDFHKLHLKEEFDVEPWTFEQHIGEAVMIPAGCPYQVKKIKSCVNMVLHFISPESASTGIMLSDEIRHLPVNHKAKENLLEVKKLTIDSVNAAVEEIRKVPEAEMNDKVE